MTGGPLGLVGLVVVMLLFRPVGLAFKEKDQLSGVAMFGQAAWDAAASTHPMLRFP
jgi:hypothetical protein